MQLDDSLFKGLLDNLSDGIYFVGLDRTIMYWNRGAERLTGYSSSEMLGANCAGHLLMHVDEEGRNLCLEGCPLHKSLLTGGDSNGDIYLHHKDGHRVPVRVRVMPLRDREGVIIGAAEIFSDNNEKISALEIIEDLQRKVFLDALTGAANRRYVDKILPVRFDEMARYGWLFGVIMMDIDHFKLVNDRYGHDVGDEVLKMITRTLLGSTRAADFVGRWGGEEFIAILSNVTALGLRKTAERYRVLVEQSCLPVEGGPIRATISAGFTLATTGDTASTLIKRADELMYVSKARGRNVVTGD